MNRLLFSHLTMASLGRPVALHAVASTADNGPVWVECCLSGTYFGHPKAKRLDWGRPLFETLIANLHANPSFRAGPDGVGCAPVIPWDYEHQSEIAKMNNAIPPGGCPSEAWTYDFQVRPGADGNPSFWALTAFLPTALQQVRNKNYRWCSLAVSPQFINPVTGIDQGPTVTSIALTNDPFIQGMVPLAATRKDSSNESGRSDIAAARLAEVVKQINATAGRNMAERVNAWMTENVATHRSLPLDQQITRASKALKLIESGQYPPEFPIAQVGESPALASVQAVVDVLNRTPGRNPAEKANAFLCSRSSAHRALPLAEQCRVAGEFARAIMRGEMPKGV